MKTSKFSDSQVMAILKRGESGVPVAALSREHGISSATYYKWRTKFDGIDASLISRLKELERENARLQADVHRRTLGRRHSQGGDGKKMVTPFVRKQMAQSAMEKRQISVRPSCQIFNVSPTCYRYAAKSRDENQVVADCLIALSLCHRTWGFGLMFLHLPKIDCSLPSVGVTRALDQVIEWRGKPSAIKSDNEPEYISAVVKEWAGKHGVELTYIQPGNPQQNAYIERFNRTMRYELLSPNLFSNIEEVPEAATQWAYAYNHDRPSMALNGRTPIQCLQAYLLCAAPFLGAFFDLRGREKEHGFTPFKSLAEPNP